MEQIAQTIRRALEPARLKKEFKETLESIVIALILALFIRAYFMQAFSIPSGSMEPTLQVGDKLLANKFIFHFKNPKQGNVVIFKHKPSIEKREHFDFYFFKLPVPEAVRRQKEFHLLAFTVPYPGMLYTWKDFIKRVVAVEGQKVEVRDGKVFVDGKPMNEPYIKEPPYYTWGPKVVPRGHLLVFGDNRNNSEDSHVWGFLDKKYLRGKAMVIYWPPTRIRLIR